MIKSIEWVILEDGLNFIYLKLTNGKYEYFKGYMGNVPCYSYADFLTNEMKRFKERFYNKGLVSRSSRPTEYRFEVKTDKKTFKTVEKEF